MLDSPIFQVIIGVVFVYSLLSILVTQVNNVVAAFLKIRAKHLRDGINELIQDPMIRAKVVTHPLVRLVEGKMVLPEQRLTDEQAREIANGKVARVAYVDPRTFVNVLMHVVRVETDKELFGALLHIIDGMPATPDRRRLRLTVTNIVNTGEGIEELRHLVANLKEPVYREALGRAIDEIDALVGRLGLEPNSIISLQAGLRNVKNPYFRKVMQTVLSTSRTMEEAEAQLMSWFNEGMERVSTAFSRWMGLLSLAVGLAVAVFLNVDTLQLARALWTDPILRNTVATIARQTDTTVLQSTFAPIVPASTPQTLDDLLKEATNALNAAQSTVTQLVELNLPMGWQWDVVEGDPNDPLLATRLANSNNLWNFIPGNSPHFFGLLLGKVIGLLATMIAIAQGAPFWFNILNRIARGSGVSLAR